MLSLTVAFPPLSLARPPPSMAELPVKELSLTVAFPLTLVVEAAAID